MKKLFKKTKENTLISKENDIFHPEIYEHLKSVLKLDINGILISFNNVFAKQYGYEKDDFNKPFLEVFLNDETLDQKQYFNKAVLGKTQKFQTVGMCKNGKSNDISITLIPIKDKNGMYVYVIINNIVSFENAERELLLPAKWQHTLNGLDDICNFYYDAINDYHYYSNQLVEIFGINISKEFNPSLKILLKYIHPEDRNRVNETVQKALENRSGYQIEYRIIRKDQSVRYLYEQAEIILDHNGHLDGLVGFIQDITKSKISVDVLEKEKKLTAFYQNPDIGIWSINIQTGECLECSKGIEQITGYSKDEFYNGVQWSSIVHPQDLPLYLENQLKLNSGITLRHQYRIIHKNGNVKWVQDYTIPTINEDGNLIQLNGLTLDITEQKSLKGKLKYMSEFDSITKLPNRQKFVEELQSLITTYTNNNQKFAIIIIDIDRFKYIIDTLGHQVGDQLLVHVANRLTKQLTSNHLLARYGEDEFSILANQIVSIESLEYLAEEIINCLKEPFYIEEYQLFVTASVGISIFPENGVNSLELLRNAKLALYKAQKNGVNKYNIISHSSSIQSYKSYIIGRDLKKALENNEMVLYFQPRVDAISNKIISAEALIRWNHPEWGIISPHEFLKIAEENGLIKDVDDWVLNEACHQLRKWKEKQIHTVPISINISAIHFSIYNWQNTVEKVIRETGIDPRNLEFEITESLLLNNNDTVQNTINFLRNMGIKIVLDDFGTGYSSLSYLTQFPFDIIKIDKSFIRDMLQNHKVLFIVKSIILLAKELKIKVVAEGVETIKQLKVLRKEQCHEIQGYLYSHPVPIDEYEVLLQKKILPPIDSKLKAKQSKRKYNRLQFPYPLEAEMQIISIAGNSVQLGSSNVLIEDMSIGGLRYVSTLNLPIRGDVIFQFKTELLGKTIKLLGTIVWKEEINEEQLEYGIDFKIDKNEQATLETLLNSFSILLKNKSTFPSYKMIKETRNHYFKE